MASLAQRIRMLRQQQQSELTDYVKASAQQVEQAQKDEAGSIEEHIKKLIGGADETEDNNRPDVDTSYDNRFE